MNSESLGYFSFGQSQPDRRANATKLDSAATINTGEARCVKGVCEVAWKPNQQSNREFEQLESSNLID